MTAGSNFGWYCPDCGTNHANTTAACPRFGITTTDAAPADRITDSAPFTGYGIRKCRGHWHVALFEAGVEGEDILVPGDPFKTAEAALAAADALNRGDSRTAPQPPDERAQGERYCQRLRLLPGGGTEHVTLRVCECERPRGPIFGVCGRCARGIEPPKRTSHVVSTFD